MSFEEGIPGWRDLSMELNVENRKPIRLMRFRKELHMSFLRRPAPFLAVTTGAGTHYVLPGGLSPLAARDNVVKSRLFRR
jgi:hypothetical protein